MSSVPFLVGVTAIGGAVLIVSWHGDGALGSPGDRIKPVYPTTSPWTPKPWKGNEYPGPMPNRQILPTIQEAPAPEVIPPLPQDLGKKCAQYVKPCMIKS